MTASAIQLYHEPGKFPAAVLALLVHLALFAVLFFGVQWRSSEPEAVTVELWDRPPAPAPAPTPPTPEITPELTPPVPAPEPPPEPVVEKKVEPAPPPRVEPKPVPKVEPKPDIAQKEKLEKKKKEEQKREELKQREEQKKRDDAKRQQAERDQMLKAERDRVLKETQLIKAQQEAAQEESRVRQQLKAASSKAIDEYVNKIRSKIRSNILVPDGIAGNPEAVFDVVQLPSGDILSAKLRKSSGYPAYDTAVERAIFKSSPLPKPDKIELFQRELVLKLKPHDVN
jgi:colicin import membrane protein